MRCPEKDNEHDDVMELKKMWRELGRMQELEVQELETELPFEETNVRRATVAESRLYPSLPSHKLPPPERLFVSKNKVMESFVVESLIPLT
jgi:hypothetical protein